MEDGRHTNESMNQNVKHKLTFSILSLLSPSFFLFALKQLGNTNFGQFFDSAGKWTYVNSCPQGNTSPMTVDDAPASMKPSTNTSSIGPGVGIGIGGLAAVIGVGAFLAKKRAAPAAQKHHVEMRKNNEGVLERV